MGRFVLFNVVPGTERSGECVFEIILKAVLHIGARNSGYGVLDNCGEHCMVCSMKGPQEQSRVLSRQFRREVFGDVLFAGVYQQS